MASELCKDMRNLVLEGDFPTKINLGPTQNKGMIQNSQKTQATASSIFGYVAEQNTRYTLNKVQSDLYSKYPSLLFLDQPTGERLDRVPPDIKLPIPCDFTEHWAFPKN